MKAEKRFKKNKNIPLFISLIIILSFTIFVSIYVITNNSLNEQNLNENSNPLKLGNLLQNQNVNPSLNLNDLIFRTSHSTSSNSKSSTSSSSSDDDSSIDNEANSENNFPEDSSTNLNNEEDNFPEDSTTDSSNEETDTTDNSDSINNEADLDDTNSQTSGDKKSKLIDDQNDGFIDVIVMLKDEETLEDEEMLRITSDPLEKKLSEIKSKVKRKQDKVLSELDSSEFRLKYKYETISGFAGKITQEGWDKLEQDPNVEAIYKDEILHTTLLQSVPLINADDVWEFGLTGEGSVVCVVDTGIDYTHPALGACEGYSIDGNIVPYSLQSPHPYPDNYDYTWTIHKDGFNKIAVHFAVIQTKYLWDKIYIKDANNNIVQTFTGEYGATWSVSVPGDIIKINLVSDRSENYFGFRIDKVLDGTATFSLEENCEKVIGGYDFHNNDNNPMDDNDHGTHVSGIIASNLVLKGVAPDAKLVAAKVCGRYGSCSGSAMIAGVDFCSLKKSGGDNIVVTTMSLGDGGEYNSTTCPIWMDRAINFAHSLGITVTVSSGNDKNSEGISYPACSPNAISVGAVYDDNVGSQSWSVCTDTTTNADKITCFTNTGDLLDVLAPGSVIFSTIRAIFGTFGFKSGTSMAAPHVAGAVALLKQYAPTASPDQIKNALKSTGKLITDPDNGLSFPRIDVLAAKKFSECSSNSDCGIDTYMGNSFCQNDNVYQNYITYTCDNPGEFVASCSNSTSPKLIEDCEHGCFEDEGRCKIEICNYGKCYYV